MARATIKDIVVEKQAGWMLTFFDEFSGEWGERVFLDFDKVVEQLRKLFIGPRYG